MRAAHPEPWEPEKALSALACCMMAWCGLEDEPNVKISSKDKDVFLAYVMDLEKRLFKIQLLFRIHSLPFCNPAGTKQSQFTLGSTTTGFKSPLANFDSSIF
jgi:hypothetical protein